MKQSLAEQIEVIRARHLAAKPASQAKIRLYYKLRDLMTAQLKREIREGRKVA